MILRINVQESFLYTVVKETETSKEFWTRLVIYIGQQIVLPTTQNAMP